MNEKFARSGVLFAQYLKRDWIKIIFWLIGLGIFSGGFVPAFEEISKGQGLVGMYETLKNPAMISMVGPTATKNAADYTIGAMYAHTMLLFCALFAMIVTALHVVSHTRKEEELGLTELIRSFQVGRQANSLAVVFEIILINSILAIIITSMMGFFQVSSIDWNGSFLFGLSIGVAGIFGGLLALVFAQLMPNSSGATGITLGIIGILYMVRAGTDVSNEDLTAWNPIGWTYLTYPFTENNWMYLYWLLIGTLGLFILAVLLENYRDMGAGYLPEKTGRVHAKRSLLSIHGFLIRINRGMMVGWLVAFAALGVAYGSIYGDF
jgi:ABC-2 type transport system permease protein